MRTNEKRRADKRSNTKLYRLDRYTNKTKKLPQLLLEFVQLFANTSFVRVCLFAFFTKFVNRQKWELNQRQE